VIGHHGSVFFKTFIIYIWVLAWLLLLYLILHRYISWPYLKRIFAWLWLAALIKFCIDFFDMYLDSLVLTDSGITIYLREWLLEYKTESFDWDKIETVSFDQKWLWDKIFVKWDILIRLEHDIEFPFVDIYNPKKQVAVIQQLKKLSTRETPVEEKQTDPEDNRKFDVLVEALWEVVKDYIDRDKQETTDEDSAFE